MAVDELAALLEETREAAPEEEVVKPNDLGLSCASKDGDREA
jgi:hypothetical protein